MTEVYNFLEKIRKLNLKTRNIIIAKNKVESEDIISLDLGGIAKIAKHQKLI